LKTCANMLPALFQGRISLTAQFPYAAFVVFLLSQVKKQMEITFHNYKLKRETKVSLQPAVINMFTI
jgi:hypothetical protein